MRGLRRVVFHNPYTTLRILVGRVELGGVTDNDPDAVPTVVLADSFLVYQRALRMGISSFPNAAAFLGSFDIIICWSRRRPHAKIVMEGHPSYARHSLSRVT